MSYIDPYIAYGFPNINSYFKEILPRLPCRTYQFTYYHKLIEEVCKLHIHNFTLPEKHRNKAKMLLAIYLNSENDKEYVIKTFEEAFEYFFTNKDNILNICSSSNMLTLEYLTTMNSTSTIENTINILKDLTKESIDLEFVVTDEFPFVDKKSTFELLHELLVKVEDRTNTFVSDIAVFKCISNKERFRVNSNMFESFIMSLPRRYGHYDLSNRRFTTLVTYSEDFFEDGFYLEPSED